MRTTSETDTSGLPDWLREAPTRPRILVTRSTIAGPGGGKIMPTVVAVAERVDAEFVLVRPLGVGALPPNVRTVGWITINAVLPTCAGVVHHGGAGTALGALAAGVPQLAVPGPGDRRHNAELIASRGAGLAVGERDITAAHLTQLITDRGLSTAATEVSAEMRALPDPAAVVSRLEALVG